MSHARPTRADRELLDLCKELGLKDARIEIGKKHHKLYVGKALVQVLCHGNNSYSGDKGLRNAVSRIRRFAAAQGAQQP